MADALREQVGGGVGPCESRWMEGWGPASYRWQWRVCLVLGYR